jgi:hypothetical protein
MSAAASLKAARDAGVNVLIDGDGLELDADAPPPPAILDLLSRHKLAILALLQPGRDGWSAEDWQRFFDERAGFAVGRGLPLPEAKAHAFASCVVEWLDRNFERSPPGRCFACGGPNYAYDALLPYGIKPTGHAWLHFHCWPTWYATRKSQAVAALEAMGITQPAEFPDDLAKNRGA